MLRRFAHFSPSPAIGVAIVAVVLSATGLAVAAIPDSNGVIHSCYSKSNGSLRVVKGTKCRKGEKKLKWNQQGETGPPGPRGAPGAAGPPGAAGTPGAAAGFAASTTGVETTVSPGADILQLNLPAGQYIVQTTMSVQNTSPSSTSSITECTLSGGTGSDDSKLGLLGPSSTPENQGSMALSMATTLSSPGTVTLHCTGEGGTGETFLNTAHLDAVQLGALS